MKHPISINAGSAALLKSVLRRPEWPTTADELVTGLMLADKIGVKDSLAELDAKKPVRFTLPENLRDLCKKAIKLCAENKLLPGSDYSMALILAFGVASPPKELEDVQFSDDATPAPPAQPAPPTTPPAANA